MADYRPSYLHQRDPSIDRRRRPMATNNLCLMDRVAEMSDDEGNSENQSSLANSAARSASTLSLNSSAEPGATVYLRMRPVHDNTSIYRIDNNLLTVELDDKSVADKQYEFSQIFQENTNQKEIYENCVNSYIENDESFTLMAYGTSSSGKTHTINGDDASPGIIPRAIVHIFTRFQNIISPHPGLKLERGNIMLVDQSNFSKEEQLRAKYLKDPQKKNSFISVFEKVHAEHDFESIPFSNEKVIIWLSFAEIYNENVYDLLSLHGTTNGNKPKKSYKIISNDGNAFIKDLTMVNVRSASEAYLVYLSGLEQVNTASTNVNNNSSRSHCIFMVNVIICTSPVDFSFCLYKFCDLAGSERQKKTENTGHRLKEAQRINTSLMVLGRCLDILHCNQQKKGKEIVPFRESKLTLLLQSGLTGREKITMIVNMLPKTEFLEENLTVLQFASIAQKIVYRPPKPPAATRRRSTRFSHFMSNCQSTMQKDDLNSSEIFELREENNQLQQEKDLLISEVERLQRQVMSIESDLRVQLVDDFEKQSNDNQQIYMRRIEDLKALVEKEKEKVGLFISTHSIFPEFYIFFLFFTE